LVINSIYWGNCRREVSACGCGARGKKLCILLKMRDLKLRDGTSAQNQRLINSRLISAMYKFDHVLAAFSAGKEMPRAFMDLTADAAIGYQSGTVMDFCRASLRRTAHRMG
jgi:hypothetical protein